MSKRSTLRSEPLEPIGLPGSDGIRAMSRAEAEPALEAALLAGTGRSNAQDRGVHLFLALYAGTILDRMESAGLAMGRTSLD